MSAAPSLGDVVTRPLILALGLPFPAAHIILGLANLGKVTAVWPTVTAMAICAGLMIVVTRHAQVRTLPGPHASVMIAGTVVIELLVQSGLPFGSHPGYAAWHCGAIEMLMVTTAIRTRITSAWLGIGLFSVLEIIASLAHGLTVVDALTFVITPVMWVAIATVVTMVLRRCDTQIRDYQSQEVESAARLAHEHAHLLLQNEWVTQLDRQTRPMLEKISAGPLSEKDRMECVLLEAELRDQIRGRSLADPAVLQAARAARSRGVSVDIYDDRGTDLPWDVRAQALAQLTRTLERAESGNVKARALPAGTDIAVTILAYDEASGTEEFHVEIRAAQQPRQ